MSDEARTAASPIPPKGGNNGGSPAKQPGSSTPRPRRAITRPISPVESTSWRHDVAQIKDVREAS